MAFIVYGLLAILVGISAFSLYKLALPKPLKGIPYDVASSKRVLGDLPDATAWMQERKEFWSFLQARCQQLKSPIVQVWMQPLGKPFIVVSDYIETQDIMVRRHAQFDRSAWLGDMFWAISPRNMTRFLTNDDWRAHRRLMVDAMSPKFLRNVASPYGHAGAMSLIKLWNAKMEIAEGRAFSVFDDVTKSAMDAMWAAVFGSDISTTHGQINALKGCSVQFSSDRNVPVEFPSAEDPETFTAMLTLGNSVAWAASSPLPKTTHWLAVNLIPNLRRAMKLKKDFLSGMLHAASQKFAASQDEDNVKHILDLVVQREVALAQKEGRAPEFDTQDIRDELFGFLLAGNETTSATICWGLKMLADHPRVQNKLRTILQETHIQARKEGRTPSPQEIFNANIAYLEATLAEILRHAGSAPGNTRRTMENTEIFGHQIPKGYDVLMLMNGAGYTSPPLPIDESRRSIESIKANDIAGMWDESDVSQFVPERWLVTDEKGQVTYDQKAGPFQSFGAGLRGCFGRKLAELNLRTFFTLILWEFELIAPPESYRSYLGLDKSMHQPQQCYLRLKKVASQE